MSKSSDSKFGLGCMILFLAPFMLVGGFLTFNAITTFIAEPEFTEDVVAMFGVGSIFLFISIGMLIALLYGQSKINAEEQLEEEHPGEPWLWRPDWRDGRVNSNAPAAAIVFWIFGIVFSGVGIPIIFMIVDEVKENPAALAALLFPLVGLGMLAAAIYSTMRWYKYGKVSCELVTNPGVIGGWFKGIVWANIAFAPNEKVDAKLSCYHRYVTGSGKQRSTHRDVQWQEDIEVNMSRVRKVDGGLTAIPVMVYVPRSCKQTTLEDANNRIEWELTTSAEVAGIDFAASFIVPVFETSESVDVAPLNDDGERLDEVIQPYTPTIAVREMGDGFALYAAPRRNAGMMFGLSIFFLIWTAIVVGLFTGSIASDVPWLFPIVFGLFDVLIGWAVVWMWLGKTWLYVHPNEVILTKKILGFGAPKTIPGSSISSVEPHINMRSGSTPYYAIRLKTGSTGKDTIGGLPSKDEAEDLCRRIRELLSL